MPGTPSHAPVAAPQAPPGYYAAPHQTGQPNYQGGAPPYQHQTGQPPHPAMASGPHAGAYAPYQSASYDPSAVHAGMQPAPSKRGALVFAVFAIIAVAAGVIAALVFFKGRGASGVVAAGSGSGSAETVAIAAGNGSAIVTPIAPGSGSANVAAGSAIAYVATGSGSATPQVAPDAGSATQVASDPGTGHTQSNGAADKHGHTPTGGHHAGPHHDEIRGDRNTDARGDGKGDAHVDTHVEPVVETPQAKPDPVVTAPPKPDPTTTPTDKPVTATDPPKTDAAKPGRTPVISPSAVTKLSGDVPTIKGDQDGDVLVKMCLDDQGAVTSATMIKNAAAAPADLIRALQTWRYKPYVNKDGKPSPACFPLSLRVVVKH